ncbi:MAG TPA: PIG-L family deacetylase [Micromonosporaceae bacterium]
MTAIDGHGTTEATWMGWDAMATWPSIDPAGIEQPVVVAPHPDDEILGIGGLLALLGHADIVAVTDGESSHPASDERTRSELGRLRPVETEAALAALGGSYSVRRLGHPDGGIDETALADTLTGLLTPGSDCIATWRGDGHPDHEAVGRAAATACAATGARLWEYPVWMWHWAVPSDPRVDWHRARTVRLPPAVLAAKVTAIGQFTSQITPIGGVTILPPHVLARFHRSVEVVFG